MQSQYYSVVDQVAKQVALLNKPIGLISVMHLSSN